MAAWLSQLIVTQGNWMSWLLDLAREWLPLKSIPFVLQTMCFDEDVSILTLDTIANATCTDNAMSNGATFLHPKQETLLTPYCGQLTSLTIHNRLCYAMSTTTIYRMTQQQCRNAFHDGCD
jgi:hypothetical protein